MLSPISLRPLKRRTGCPTSFPEVGSRFFPDECHGQFDGRRHRRCEMEDSIKTWTVSTVVGKSVYLRDQKNMMALDLGWRRRAKRRSEMNVE